MRLHIYAPFDAPRLRYILDFWCAEILHCDYVLYHSEAEYRQAPGPRLNYSQKRLLAAECFLPAQGFLQNGQAPPSPLTVFQHRGLPAFFQLPLPEADLPFDLLSLSFYLLSRYEEYEAYQPDAHHRFPAAQSLAHRAGFLQRPLIDLWGQELRQLLQAYFPDWSIPPRSYRFLPTYDIDMAWAYLHKGYWRLWGGALKAALQGQWSALKERWLVGWGQAEDPFYTFAYMEDLHKKFQLRPTYFFLLGSPGPYDKNIAPAQPAFQQLIRDLAQRYPLGIHPSYRSNEEPALLEREKQSLENIIGKNIQRSRQHYLKLRLPETYRRLLAAGIREDYTLGFADAIGFRAGTGSPFFWYDLEQEQVTPLRLYPLVVMDATMQQYLGWTPQEAVLAVKAVAQELRELGGTLSILWHNSSLSEREGWENWREAYEQILASCRE